MKDERETDEGLVRLVVIVLVFDVTDEVLSRVAQNTEHQCSLA